MKSKRKEGKNEVEGRGAVGGKSDLDEGRGGSNGGSNGCPLRGN